MPTIWRRIGTLRLAASILLLPLVVLPACLVVVRREEAVRSFLRFAGRLVDGLADRLPAVAVVSVAGLVLVWLILAVRMYWEWRAENRAG